jgi:hypothetical protein
MRVGLQVAYPPPVGGWVCYRLVSELLVETPGRYGPGLLVRASWSRSNSDREIENLRRNSIAEATQETKRHRSSVRVRRIVTVPFEFGSDRHCRIRRDLGSLDQRTSEQGSSDENKARTKVMIIRSHWRERSMANRHCGKPSCMGVNFPRQSRNPNHGFTEGLCVSIRRIAR